MHTVGKVLSAIGGIIVIVCVLIFGFAVGDVSEKSADVNYVISGENNGIVTVFDDDNLGDWGFTIFIEGPFEDDNTDGVWDNCDSVNITAIHDGRFMENYGSNESYSVDASDEDRFYFEMRYANSECNTNVQYETRNVDGKELIKIGRACWGCMSGNLTIESNEPIWVVNDDEEAAELVGGMFAATSSFCFLPCGCCILIVGLIAGFTMDDGVTVVPAVTVEAGAQTAPVSPEIAMPTGDSDPAEVYYALMISRGFEPELAERMTKDHYPGFNE